MLKQNPKLVPNAEITNIPCQIRRGDYGLNFAGVFFVRSVMEKVGFSTKMTGEWLPFLIAVIVPL